MGRLEEAAIKFQASLSRSHEVLGTLGSEARHDDKCISFADSLAASYASLVRVMLQLGRCEEALMAADGSKAISLADRVAEMHLLAPASPSEQTEAGTDQRRCVPGADALGKLVEASRQRLHLHLYVFGTGEVVSWVIDANQRPILVEHGALQLATVSHACLFPTSF